MTKKMLVPLDGSSLAEEALTVATKMADANIELWLLRVVGPLSFSAKSRVEAERYLEETAARLRLANPEVTIVEVVEEGSPAELIIDVAEREEAGLIIMTTHGKGGLGRWLVGSVPERVVRHAHCPVLTIGRRSLEATKA